MAILALLIFAGACKKNSAPAASTPAATSAASNAAQTAAPAPHPAPAQGATVANTTAPSPQSAANSNAATATEDDTYGQPISLDAAVASVMARKPFTGPFSDLNAMCEKLQAAANKNEDCKDQSDMSGVCGCASADQWVNSPPLAKKQGERNQQAEVSVVRIALAAADFETCFLSFKDGSDWYLARRKSLESDLVVASI